MQWICRHLFDIFWGTMSTYEVIIIGAGPAGLFAALSLENLGVGKVLLVEQGPDLEERHRDGPGGLLCGWGGAGAFSDGKLILSPEVGGFLSDLIPLEDLNVLIQEVDSIYLSLGASPETFGGDPDTLELLKTKARHAGMIFIPTRLRHIGTENCQKILTRLQRAFDRPRGYPHPLPGPADHGEGWGSHWGGPG